MCLCFRLHHSICHHGTQGISCSLFPPYFTHQKKGNLNILDLKYTHCHPLSLHILPHLLPSLTTHTQKNTILMIPLPSSLLSQLTHSQSKYYMLLEYLSRFYRTLVSTPPWFRYLSNAQNSGAVFAVIITAAYLMIKGGVIFSRLRELFRAFVNFLQDPVSGSLEVNAFSLHEFEQAHA